MRYILIAAALVLAACTSTPASPPPPTTITLTGEITRADHQTYRELPFIVPPGTHRITIDFSYDKENRTVIDLGLRDPQGQRGWSGGNKGHIEVSDGTATPSYKPGAIQPGEWKLILGVPNIREGQTSPYKADITVSPSPAPAKSRSAYTPSTIAPVRGWRRGDFHMHTAHSDGSCDVVDARAPCPSIHTFEAARDANLDFIAITDHNTITQLADITAQQAAFPKTLLIPGTEITTFNGHANVIGNTDFLDFQLGSPRLPTLNKLFDQAEAAGAFVSVNHPGLPSGEICMGCGWTVKDTDWSRVTAIEVANGSSLRTGGPAAGLRFWDNLLQQGYRLTAIGGSDNHDATDRTGAKQPPIGYPTTAVYSSGLSASAIIDGVKSGRVFIDLADLPEAWIDMGGYAPNQRSASMGGEIKLSDGEAANIIISRHAAPAGAHVVIVSHNLSTSALLSPGPSPLERVEVLQTTVKLNPGAASGYIRAELRDAADKILMIGNPIYVSAR